MKESAIKKTNIAIIIFTVVIAVALYIGAPGRFQAASTSDATASNVVSFYNGAVIRWIIPNNPGGGYDEYARLLAPYLEKYSRSRVQLSNVPGSGGMRALSELYKSPADGLTIGLVNGSGMMINQIAGTSTDGYQVSDLLFLARITRDQRVLTLAGNSAYASFSELLHASQPLKFGATGFGGSTYMDAVIIKNLFGLNVSVIHGFSNSSVVRLEMMRGRLDGTWSSWGSVIDDVASGSVKPVLQGGRSRAVFLPEVPTIHEWIGQSDDPVFAEQVLTAWDALHDVGRPVAVPAGVAPVKLEFLRRVFRQAMQDPQFLKDAERAGRSIDYASAEELEEIIGKAQSVPADVQQFFAQSLRSEL